MEIKLLEIILQIYKTTNSVINNQMSYCLKRTVTTS